jgi:hypothetical protein
MKATFSNQTSNLSALGAAMGSFGSQILNLSSADSSEDFLACQQDRLTTVEQELLSCTQLLLPPTKASSTITELAEITRLVQEATALRLRTLENRLAISSSPKIEEMKEAMTKMATPETVFWSLGGPLESVLEGDIETEGATTPGSMLMSPYSVSRRRKSSISPATPTMDSISFRYVLSHSM